jgi:hypothetical protein
MFDFCYDFIRGMTADARHAMTTRCHCGMINRLWNTFAAAVLIAVTLFGADAWAQTSRTIRIVVPFPPGGSADILARLLGEQLSKSQGPTVIIENRPGGGPTNNRVEGPLHGPPTDGPESFRKFANREVLVIHPALPERADWL